MVQIRLSRRQVAARARISKNEGSRQRVFFISSIGSDKRGALLLLAASTEGNCIVAACAGLRWRYFWFDNGFRRITEMIKLRLAFVTLWMPCRLSANHFYKALEHKASV